MTKWLVLLKGLASHSSFFHPFFFYIFHTYDMLILTLLFFIFCFLWCYVLQGDLYATYWYATTGSEDYPQLFITLILCLIATAIYWLAMMWLSRRWAEKPHRWLKQSATTILLILGIGSCGYTDELRHLELATARLCAEGKFERALEIGSRYQVPSTILTALRTYALLQLEEKTNSNDKVCTIRFTTLPSHFFEYPHRWGEQELTLSPSQRQALQPFGKHIGRYNAQAQSDITLVKLLLKRDLNAFVKTLSRHCNIRTTPLPRAYAEALILYQRLTSNPIAEYHDSAIEANYNDFREIESRTPTNHVLRANTLRDNYGETYWWYYLYGDIVQSGSN